jgi:hypothetical protein
MRNAEWNGRSDNKGRSFLRCAAVIYALPFLNDVKSLAGELGPASAPTADLDDSNFHVLLCCSFIPT